MSLAEMTLEEIFTARPDAKQYLMECSEAKAQADELKTLREELDAYKAKEALAARKAIVDAKLTEASLPEAVLTAVFLESCYEADDAKLAKLIEDRQAIAKVIPAAKPAGQKPKSTEQSVAVTESVEQIVPGKRRYA
jgi:acetyl-CoA acetyltransferase